MLAYREGLREAKVIRIGNHFHLPVEHSPRNEHVTRAERVTRSLELDEQLRGPPVRAHSGCTYQMLALGEIDDAF